MKTTLLSLLLAVGLISCASASVLTGDLTNGLVAYYSFDGNANDSVGGNNISLQGTSYIANRFGNTNSALQLSPTSGGFSMYNVGITGNSDRTISLWMKPDSGLNWPQGNLIHWGQATPNNTSTIWYEPYHLQDGGVTLGFYAFNTDAHVLTQPSDLSDAWHMLTIAYSGTQFNTKFFIDGMQQTSNFSVSTSGDGTINTIDSPLRINYTDNNGFYGFSGTISDLSLYNTALTSQQVSQLYGIQSAPEPSTYALLGIGALALIIAYRRKVA